MIPGLVRLTTFSQPRKRRKLSRHIPEELYAPGRRDVEIVSVNDIHYDYTLLSAQLELTKADPTYIIGPGSSSLPFPLLHTKLTWVLRPPFYAFRDSNAVSSVEQVQHCPICCTQFGRRHDRTIRSSHHPMLKAISASKQYPVRSWSLMLLASLL